MGKRYTVIIKLRASHFFWRHAVFEMVDFLVNSANHPVERWTRQQLDSRREAKQIRMRCIKASVMTMGQMYIPCQQARPGGRAVRLSHDQRQHVDKLTNCPNLAKHLPQMPETKKIETFLRVSIRAWTP